MKHSILPEGHEARYSSVAALLPRLVYTNGKKRSGLFGARTYPDHQKMFCEIYLSRKFDRYGVL